MSEKEIGWKQPPRIAKWLDNIRDMAPVVNDEPVKTKSLSRKRTAMWRLPYRLFIAFLDLR